MNEEVPRQYAPRQFSLAGLLSFVLACAFYFGLLRETVTSLGEPGNTIRTSPWQLIATIVISWGGLLALYRCWKLNAALVIHYTGPVACGLLALMFLAVSLSPAHTMLESIQAFFYVLLYGPFISVLFGFPVVVVMLIYRVLKRD
jgi:hypothetical protein